MLINNRAADRVDLNDIGRDDVRKFVRHEIVETISHDFQMAYGRRLWRQKDIDDCTIYSGSTAILMNPENDRLDTNISLDLGDVDVMVNSEDGSDIEELLKKMMSRRYLSIELIGWKISPGCIISLWFWKHQELNIQVDFELSEFENGSPTEWARFARSSNILDRQSGVKGVFHKLLFMSLLSHEKKEYAIRQVRKHKQICTTLDVLSVFGMRTRYELTGNDVQGIPEVIETKSKDYIKDLEIIFRRIFGEPRGEWYGPEMLWSFEKIISLIRKKWPEPEDHWLIVEDYILRLFGPKAQCLYREDYITDMRIKTWSVVMLQRLGLFVDQAFLEKTIGEYYAKMDSINSSGSASDNNNDTKDSRLCARMHQNG